MHKFIIKFKGKILNFIFKDDKIVNEIEIDNKQTIPEQK